MDFELNYTAAVWEHPPPQAAGAQYLSLDVDPGEVPAAARPASLAEPLPQPRLVRHTAQEAEFMPAVPILDSPVPLGGTQLVAAEMQLVSLLAEELLPDGELEIDLVRDLKPWLPRAGEDPC